MADKSVVMVTGCSSGFGRLMVETLARRGHTVIGGMRDPEGKNAGPFAELKRLTETEKLPLHVVPLDVTSDASTNAAMKKALAVAGRIDALVNNAGIACFGITEAFTVDQVTAQFDTNVFGALRMNRAVLPHMRAAGRGLLIQISTSTARVPMPFMGVYCAAKAAAEMLAEEARYELAPLGIDSTILEATLYPTPMLQKMTQPADAERLAGYGPTLGFMGLLGKAQEWMLSTRPDPQEVADAVIQLVEAAPGTRPLRTLVGAIHAEGTATLNQTTDSMVGSFYGSMGVAGLVQLRTDGI